ncbi:AP-4 complex subunit epsilon-1-like isoform X2 [Acanthaster planci]|nr:AP-4 complex subunit epsilon-1-like isoform X2 [Acanthaster planci]XP_022109151.1 AP-4 complex subunit epsilon-1-like isoform X2 [Acanthaster planci]XP_022109152.1 AP-4 complex subunit epsilon-1-like isoform X2 [Acanthaster planci]
MSEVMEKTFSSVSGFIMNSLGSRNMDVSPGFHNLIRSIRRARSKTEEEKAIQKELELLKLKLQQPDTTVAKIKEYLVRIMYCELLGYSAGFSYISAIKLAQQGSLATKRVGYLAVGLFLHESHELILLLVNTLQRDLTSTNMLHNCMALGAICQLIGPEMVPAILPLVEEKLKHSKALVRKKAIMALRALYAKAPHMLQNPDALFKQALCDRDSAVTNAALHVHSDLIKENPAANKQLVRPLVAVLRQVAGHKLSSDVEYHGVSAPWMQIRLLRMLARLGTGDEHHSNLMYDLLDDMIEQTSTLSHNIAYAVQYECLITIASIHPHEQLLNKAAQCIRKFLKSFNYNLKYMGICALSAILKVFPSCGEEHQMTVIDCLDDADDTIRLKTLDLLFRMTTSTNIEVICDRLLTFLQGTRDAFIRRDLLSKIIQLVEQYQPSVHWYLDTMTQVMLTGGDLVPRSLVNSVIFSIAKDARNGGDVGQHALQLYLPLINKSATSSELRQICCWVLGEFACLPSAPPATEIVSILRSQLDSRQEDNVKIWAMGALTKVVASCGVVSEDVVRVIEACQIGSSMELRQRACELQTLCSDLDLMNDVYPRLDSSPELQFDWTLSFLDEYVSEALAQGAAPYKPKQQRHAERQQASPDIKPLFSGLNFVPYQSPTSSVISGTAMSVSTTEGKTNTKSVSPDPSLSSGASANSAGPKASESSAGLKLDGVKRVWGSKGYAKTTSTTLSYIQPRTNEGLVPASPPATPSSPARVAQPSIQLSSAMAVGRTTSSPPSSVDTLSEEDCRKKELAKALFGGLHKSMTTSSKKPMDRKPQFVSTSERSSKSAAKDEKSSNITDLLVLSDVNALSSDRNLPQVELSNVQYPEEKSNTRLKNQPEEKENLDTFLTLTEENINAQLVTPATVNFRVTNQGEQLVKAELPGEDQKSSAGSIETYQGGRPAMAFGRTSGQELSMYEEFKGMDLDKEYSNSQIQIQESNSLSLQDEGPTGHQLPYAPDSSAVFDSVSDMDDGHGEEKTHQFLNLQGKDGRNPIDSSEVTPDTSSADCTLRDDSSSSIGNSDVNLLDTRTSQAHPSETAPPCSQPNKEISLLDSSPGDVSLPSQPELLQNRLPADWQDYPRSRDRINLGSDTLLAVTLYKVWKPSTLGLVFHVTNISPKDSITQLKIKLDVTSNLKVSDDLDHHPLSTDLLGSTKTSILTAELGCISPAPSMSLGGEVAYKDHTRTHRRLFFSSPITISDLLRPLKLQTAEFGEQWPKQTCDSKFTVELVEAVSMSKVMTLLTQEMNIHLVEIIGNEGIACGTLLGRSVCLIHTKLPSDGSLELWVRSSSRLLSESVTKQCREVMKKL